MRSEQSLTYYWSPEGENKEYATVKAVMAEKWENKTNKKDP